ncbi:sulfatase family protein [Spirosoma arcticum]
MKLLVFLPVLLLGYFGLSLRLPAPNLTPPNPLRNVIVIIGDDHAAHDLGCYGNPVVRTPNLDRLAGQSAQFERAYVNSPVCTPSRQSFLTGKMPHAAGVTLLTTALPDTTYTLAEHLKKQGFKTACIGKTHFNSELTHGFDELVWQKEYNEYLKTVQETLPATVRYSQAKHPWNDPVQVFWNAEGLPAPHHDEYDIGTFFANRVNDFLDRNRANRFCLWVGFKEPHAPFNFPIEYANRYQPDELILPTGSPEDDRYEPLVFKALTTADRRGIMRSYYTSTEYLDKNIGLILDKIQSLNLTNETLIIYLGDNGYLLNHHKRFEKHTMWEEAVRVPLIIRAGVGNPQVISSLTEMIDLAPTILAALGVETMPGLHGKSLLPLLAGQTNRHKDLIFSEYLPDNKAMVRTAQYKYVFTNGKRDLGMGYATGNPPAGIHHELYDLQHDSRETTNVFTKAAYRKIGQDLQNRMLAVFRQTHPNAGLVAKNQPVDRQLAAFCEPPEGERPDDK